MSTYTRRTHVVRIPLDGSTPTPGGQQPASYVDVEVLDAIAFRKQNGDEIILNAPAATSSPIIVDNTGGGNAQTMSPPTQLCHMKRIVGSADTTQILDVEVIDCMAFRDQNGEEWILDMGATSDDPDAFDTTDGSGGGSATRRVHDEIITHGGTSNTGDKPANYVTVERVDAIAFRKVRGEEVIFLCPSGDDPNGPVPRASTFTWSPTGNYDPSANDDTASASTPPPNTDPHVYVSKPSVSQGINLGDTKIKQGPFWWIRDIGGNEILTLEIDMQNGLGFSWLGANFLTDGQVLGGDIYAKNAKNTQVDLVDPISSPMLENLYSWQSEIGLPLGTQGAPGSFTMRTLLFFNMTLIKRDFNNEFNITYKVQNGTPDQPPPSNIIYIVWANYPWTALTTPDSDNWDKISQFVGNFGGHPPVFSGLPIYLANQILGADGTGGIYSTQAAAEAFVSQYNALQAEEFAENVAAAGPDGGQISVSFGYTDPVTGEFQAYSGLIFGAGFPTAFTVPIDTGPPVNPPGPINVTVKMNDYLGQLAFPIADGVSPPWSFKAAQSQTLTFSVATGNTTNGSLTLEKTKYLLA